ncbi:hypothetical protein ACP70R_003349 [Stipagrostis hirtigluma subsp. patula]
MEYSRSGPMDVSLSIPAPAASMENSEERVATIFPPRPTALPKSSSNKIMPVLGFQNETSHSHPSRSSATRMEPPLIKKVAAEFLGTFLLVFAVLSALVTNATRGGALGVLGVAAAAGLALAVLVASLAHVSGAHFNPAVSVAMAVFGHLPRAHLVPYVAAQLLGSMGSAFAAKVLHDPVNFGATVATVPTVGTVQALVVEFVATFIFLFVVTALATDPNAVKELVAVGVGATVMMNALIFGELTGASMNPARTLGAAIAVGTYTKIWVYMIAPPLGAIAGAGAYTALK